MILEIVIDIELIQGFFRLWLLGILTNFCLFRNFKDRVFAWMKCDLFIPRILLHEKLWNKLIFYQRRQEKVESRIPKSIWKY